MKNFGNLPPHRVRHVASCDLSVEQPSPTAQAPWPFAEANRAAIDAHWTRAKQQNPAYFDGTVFVMTQRHQLADNRFSAVLRPVRFREFLYWRDGGMADHTVFDCFGSAIVRTSDGAVLLGRQRPGNINAGRTYLPGGFIDPRDCLDDGDIDIAANVTREVREETGLGASDLIEEAGVFVTEVGQQVSLGVAFRTTQSADAVLRSVRAHIASEAEPELADVMFAESSSDLVGVDVPTYARCLLATLLAD